MPSLLISFSPIHVSLETSFRWKVRKADRKQMKKKKVPEEFPFFKFHANQITIKITTNHLLNILEIPTSLLLGYELMVKEKNYNG